MLSSDTVSQMQLQCHRKQQLPTNYLTPLKMMTLSYISRELHGSTGDDRYDAEVGSDAGSIAYDVVAMSIFFIVAYTFLFPCNRIFPFDRRTVAVLGATLTYVCRSFIFPHRKMNIVGAIDFDVLILLSSIMAINHIIVHLKETKKVISYMQKQVKADPRRGFWLISFAAFIVAPFLTNDGVCLLFVEIILNAFDDVVDDDDTNALTNGAEQIGSNNSSSIASPKTLSNQKLEKADAMYFLLTLACSSNIGSALTYTGNPQNMIVAQDSIEVLPPGKFLGFMLIPAILAWLMTTYYLERCWYTAKLNPSYETTSERLSKRLSMPKLRVKYVRTSLGRGADEDQERLQLSPTGAQTAVSTKKTEKPDVESCGLVLSCVPTSASEQGESATSPLTPRRRAKKDRDAFVKKISHVVTSPFPYMIILLFIAMIVMIFVDVMSISGLVCCTACVMIVTLVIGNHWRGLATWDDDSAEEGADEDGSLTFDDKIQKLNEFFESLFTSIDWSLLMIFLGTFVVVANIDSTGIPKKMWQGIVGDKPFNTVGSVVGCSLFVLVASQLLGNVAVCYLIKPNVSVLDDQAKAYAWAVISFVATVGGNLTITGSAANIIVSEKAARIDPTQGIDFFKHYRCCFWITLLSCVVGTAIITGISAIDNL